MAEPQTHDNLAQNPPLQLSHSTFSADPDPGTDHPASSSTAAAASSDRLSNEDPDLTREPKRRKHCPTALENLDELTPASNSGFTFTFDTKFCGFSAEVTPKFGSFNSIIPEIEEKIQKERSSLVGEEKEETLRRVEEEEEDDEEESDVVVSEALREAIGGLGSVVD